MRLNSKHHFYSVKRDQTAVLKSTRMINLLELTILHCLYISSFLLLVMEKFGTENEEGSMEVILRENAHMTSGELKTNCKINWIKQQVGY